MKKVIRNLLFVVGVMLIALTPAINDLVNQSRAVCGYGGECLLWTFPLFIGLSLESEEK